WYAEAPGCRLNSPSRAPARIGISIVAHAPNALRGCRASLKRVSPTQRCTRANRRSPACRTEKFCSVREDAARCLQRDYKRLIISDKSALMLLIAATPVT